MDESCQVPEMYGEVLEAIHNTFVDYPDVEADCYVFLSNLFQYVKLSTTMSAYAAQALTEMGRCSVCCIGDFHRFWVSDLWRACFPDRSGGRAAQLLRGIPGLQGRLRLRMVSDSGLLSIHHRGGQLGYRHLYLYSVWSARNTGASAFDWLCLFMHLLYL